MLVRVVVALVAVLAIGTVLIGVSLIFKQQDPPAGACPATLDEARAVDTFKDGLPPAERSWGITGGAPGRVRAGQIAAFLGGGAAPLSVITIDPDSGARCTLVRLAADYPLREHHVTSFLDWSPSGDALAIGLEELEEDDEPGFADTHVLIWTPTRLFRVWSGPAQAQAPRLEWAPDGRSIAVWSVAGALTPVVVIHADGSPDLTFRLKPTSVTWSPDGSRWVTRQAEQFDGPSTVLVVDVADGRVTPFDLGISYLNVVGWLDDSRVLLVEFEKGVGPVRYLDVPVDAPETYSVIPFPEEVVTGVNLVLSPDRQRAAYSDTETSVALVDLTEPAGAPLHVTLDETGFLAEHAWSPDGSFVLIASLSRVWIVNADGSAPRQVAADVSPLGDPWQPMPVR